MTTLREIIETNIKKAEDEAQKYRNDLALLEQEGAGWLEREVNEARTFIQGLASHLFSPAANEAVAAAPAPVAVPVETPPAAPSLTVIEGGGQTTPPADGTPVA